MNAREQEDRVIRSLGAYIVGAAAALVAVLWLSGCTTVADVLGRIGEWNRQQAATNAPPVIGSEPAAAPVPPDTAADEVPFGGLRWVFGGEDGGGAQLSTPRIASLGIADGKLKYKWAGEALEAWGLPKTEAGALACLFVRRSDGQWVGGKFEWVSTSRTSRSLKNISEGYKGWSLDGIPREAEAAFVIISADRRKRTNVIRGLWRR